MRYLKSANSLEEFSNPTSVWSGTLRAEENHLNQCLRILEVRLQSVSKKRKQSGQ